jgi:hypothetical protein
MSWSDTHIPLILRLLAVLLLVGVGFWVAISSALLWAYPFWLAASILVAFPLAGFLSGPIGSIFMPTEVFSKPQPMYSIPESLRMKNELDKAFAAYQKIAEEYPQEVKPYVAMVKMAFVDMKNDNLAESVLAQGMTHLKKQASKEQWQREYDAIITMTQVTPTAESRRKVSYRKLDLKSK